MFGGSVQGVYRELVPFSRLQLDWRFGNWPDAAISKVCDGHTLLCTQNYAQDDHDIAEVSLLLQACCNAAVLATLPCIPASLVICVSLPPVLLQCWLKHQ